MRFILTLLLLTYLFNLSNAQVSVSAKVIPWKYLDNLDSLKITVKSSTKELLKKAYSVKEFYKKDTYYRHTLFRFELNEFVNNITFEVSYKYRQEFNSRTENFSHPIIITSKMNSREERVELEIHFQKYYDEKFNVSSKEKIEELVIKKIYSLPVGISLIRAWNPQQSANPKYIIQNDTRFKLYGQAADGKFEGQLYRIVDNQFEQVRTGGYIEDLEPSKQLYRDNHTVSNLRDHREIDNKFRIKDAGEYLYKVYLGFLPYESSSRFGDMPYYSVNKNEFYDYFSKNKIYEYFELTDKFVIN